MVVRRARVLCLVLIGVAVASGCGQGLPSKGRLKTMLAEAAATTEADLLVAEEHGYWSEIENQTLSLVFAGTRPSEVSCGWESAMSAPFDPPLIKSLTDQWTVHELLRCLTPPEPGILGRLTVGFGRGGDELSDKSISLLWSEFITEVEVSAEGDAAGGAVTFDRPGCFRGKVPFSMRRSEEGWEVVSFDLLDAGWRVEWSRNGDWSASRRKEIPSLPDFEGIDRYLTVVLTPTREDGLQVKVDSLAIQIDKLSHRVSGQAVFLRSDDGVDGGQYLEVVRELHEANPPILGLFTITKSMIDGCWCLLGIDRDTPMKRLLSDNSLASPMFDVFRTQLRRKAISFCVGGQGITLRCPGIAPMRADESIRDAVLNVMETVRRRPETPVLVSVGSEAKYFMVDMAMAIAVRSGAEHIFLRTNEDRGVVFKVREDQGCGTTMQDDSTDS